MAVVAVLAVLTAALLSFLPIELAVAAASLPLLLWLSVCRPGLLSAALIVLVVLQDALVGAGATWLQAADEAIVLVLAAGLGIRLIRSGTLSRTPLDRATLCLAGTGLAATVLQSVPLTVALLGGLSIFKGLLSWHVAARVRLRGLSTERFLEGVAWIAAALGLLAVIQRIGGEPVYAAMGRLAYFERYAGGKAPSVFYNHNALGHALVLGGALALGLAMQGRPRSRMSAAAVACLAGLLVSASREAWLGAAAGLLLAPLVLRSRRLLAVALIVVSILAIGGTAVYASSETMRTDVAQRSEGVIEGWRDFRLGFSGDKYRGEYRVYIVLKSIEVWRDHMWLGTGPGRFGGQVAVTHQTPIYETYNFQPLDGAHIPLDVFWSRLLAEWGLAGTLCFVWAYGLVLSAHLVAIRATDPLARAVGLGGIVAWGAMLVFGMFAPALEDPLTSIPFWAWGGLSWQLARSAGIEGGRRARVTITHARPS